MVELKELPTEPGIYRVETSAGTMHIITVFEGYRMWERHPGSGTYEGTYDFESVLVRRMDDGWRVRGHGYLIVDDGGYLAGETWHRTGEIVLISLVDSP